VIHVQKKTKGLLLKNIVRSVKKSYAQNALNGICGVWNIDAHSVHSFSSHSEQYFSATSLLFFSEHGSQIASMMDLQVEIL
jgi:hypothetical protein